VESYRPLEDRTGTVLQISGTRANLDMAEYVHGYLTGLLCGEAVERMTGSVAAGPRPAPMLPPAATLTIDAYLDWSELSLELALDLERLAPFGPGNPPLVLASRNLRLVSHSMVGREKEHLILTVEDETGLARRLVWWNGVGYLETSELPQGSFDLAYSLRASTFRGQRDLQLEWVDFLPVESDVALEMAPLEVVDYRQQVYPLEVLQRLVHDLSLDPLQIWAEGKKWADHPFDEFEPKTRYDLSPCKTLVIWTSPPGRAELIKAMKMASPEKVVLFGIDPGDHQPQEFLERLAGMVKYAISKCGSNLRIASITSALAQRETTIIKGLEWLEAKGMISIVKEGSMWEEVILSGGGKPDQRRAEQMLGQIKELLEETRAYRAWFRRADLEVP